MLGIINKTCKENDIELSVIYSDNIVAYDLITRLETLDEIRQWSLSVFCKLISVLSKDSLNTNSDIVKKAIIYMKKNYHNNISQQTVADEIGISNAYLSTLFKTEMKIGFLDYLTNLRLEKAQILLTQGNHDIRDVVRSCGFNDYSYFFKIFKKNFGITPKEFIYEKKVDT